MRLAMAGGLFPHLVFVLLGGDVPQVHYGEMEDDRAWRRARAGALADRGFNRRCSARACWTRPVLPSPKRKPSACARWSLSDDAPPI